MSAAIFLVIVLGLSVAAVAIQATRRQLRTKQIRELAAKSNLHYSAMDRFALAERIAPKLDCPGAANVHISDLVYGLKDERFRYIFTIEYTRGALRIKRTLRRAVLVTEPKNRAARDDNLQLTSADGALNLIEQYQQLVAGTVGQGPDGRAAAGARPS